MLRRLSHRLGTAARHVLLAVPLAACGADASAGRAASVPLTRAPSSGVVAVRSVASNLYLALSGAGRGGAAVQRRAGSGGPAAWTVAPQADGSLVLLERSSGSALDISGGSGANGAPAILWPYHGGDNQRWRVQPSGRGGAVALVNVHSGLCLDVGGGDTSEGAKLLQWSCHGSSNQQWVLAAPAATPAPTSSTTATPAPTSTTPPAPTASSAPPSGCSDAAGWPADWSAQEDALLTLVNQHRAAGASCAGVAFPPVPPLTAQAQLRSAARGHACQMANRNYFDHNDPDGTTPWQRIQATGYSYSAAAENIAAGGQDAQATMSQWMGDYGHCANVMNAEVTQLGNAVYILPGSTYTYYWVQDFARP